MYHIDMNTTQTTQAATEIRIGGKTLAEIQQASEAHAAKMAQEKQQEQADFDARHPVSAQDKIAHAAIVAAVDADEARINQADRDASGGAY